VVAEVCDEHPMAAIAITTAPSAAAALKAPSVVATRIRVRIGDFELYRIALW